MQSFLDFFGGKELNRFFNLNETVVYGTAGLAAILSEDRSIKVQNVLLLNVVPLSLGNEIASGK